MQNSTCDLVNVCLDDLVSTVETASVTADGHSPSNLISGDFRARYKGFRVEHYIRPPVTLELELRVPMCISHILLCPDLPQGAEMKVELNGSMGRGLSWCRLSPGVISVKSDMILVLRNKQLHRNVGQELLSVPRLSRMVHRSFASTDLERLGLIDCALKYTNILQHLKCLELRVVKWSGHKPVTFKWMEIWGIASKNCSKEENILFQTIRTAPNSSNESFNRPPGLFKRAGEEFSPQPAVQHLTPPANKMNSKACTSNKAMAISNDSSSTDVASNSSNSIEFGQDMVVSSKGLCMEQVPERFLDEITFEVMTLPMLLPSGHCVDQSTLDKLAQNDTARGRSPSDPFTGTHNHSMVSHLLTCLVTGVPLTESCKPKFCAELKSQLDRYFSVNKGVGSGRTLGSSRDIQKHLLKS